MKLICFHNAILPPIPDKPSKQIVERSTIITEPVIFTDHQKVEYHHKEAYINQRQQLWKNVLRHTSASIIGIH